MMVGVPCKVYIRRVADGAARIKHDEWYGNPYAWKEGNYSCDCNRHLFFQRAAQEGEGEDAPCGDVLYAINKIELEDGTIVYSEEP